MPRGRLVFEGAALAWALALVLAGRASADASWLSFTGVAGCGDDRDRLAAQILETVAGTANAERDRANPHLRAGAAVRAGQRRGLRAKPGSARVRARAFDGKQLLGYAGGNDYGFNAVVMQVTEDASSS
jgi:hypothetical protein